MLWNRGGHNVTFGGDFRRQEFNYSVAAESARNVYLHGRGQRDPISPIFCWACPTPAPSPSATPTNISARRTYDAYVNDDWRISPELTLNAGIRWEYGAPITELYGRLVNLDIAPGFTAELRWWRIPDRTADRQHIPIR